VGKGRVGWVSRVRSTPPYLLLCQSSIDRRAAGFIPAGIKPAARLSLNRALTLYYGIRDFIIYA